jgi:GNAT superfamily N-acetyltransferase
VQYAALVRPRGSRLDPVNLLSERDPEPHASARPYAIIENVVTNEAVRGKGYGKRIIAHALEAAWAACSYKVMLQTGSKRESTHAFYRACGFSGEDKHGYVAWSPSFERR